MEARRELELLLTRLPSMRQRFEAAGAGYHGHAAAAEAGTFAEQWSRVPIHSLHPLGIERERREAPGRPMKAAPNKLAGWICSGIDARGAVAFVYEYVSAGGQRYESFWEHNDDGVSTVLYDCYEPADNVINVERVEFADGRPVRFLRYARVGAYVEVYRYNTGKLERIHGASKEHDAPGGPVFTLDDIEYGPGDRPARILRHWDGGISEQIYPTSGR